MSQIFLTSLVKRDDVMLTQKHLPVTLDDRTLTTIYGAEGFRLVPVKNTRDVTCTRCVKVTCLTKFSV